MILSYEHVQIHASENLCSYATNPPHFYMRELLLCDILITRAGDGRWPRYQAKSLACPGCGVHPLSWLLSNNRLEKVPFVSVRHTSSNRLLLSNQDKGCTPSVAHSLALPLGPALLNLWTA